MRGITKVIIALLVLILIAGLAIGGVAYLRWQRQSTEDVVATTGTLVVCVNVSENADSSAVLTASIQGVAANAQSEDSAEATAIGDPTTIEVNANSSTILGNWTPGTYLVEITDSSVGSFADAGTASVLVTAGDTSWVTFDLAPSGYSSYTVDDALSASESTEESSDAGSETAES